MPTAPARIEDEARVDGATVDAALGDGVHREEGVARVERQNDEALEQQVLHLRRDVRGSRAWSGQSHALVGMRVQSTGELHGSARSGRHLRVAGDQKTTPWLLTSLASSTTRYTEENEQLVQRRALQLALMERWT